MDLTPYIDQLREDLVAAAAVGDEQIRRAASVLASAIEPSTRLAVMNALSDLAAEVTGALDDTTVDIRLAGRDVKVHVTRHEAAAAEVPAPAAGPDGAAWNDPEFRERFGDKAEELRKALGDASGELSRTTVRMFNDLKAQAEQAASDQGVSLNTYIQRAVSEALSGAMPPGGFPGAKGPRGPVGPGRSGRGGRTVTGYIQA
ncbi:toxin-antitoxin system HicB family antitoxin [Nakamurella sp. YIM 132087]|uniref:Toxin-antitoxin system HicB family antitoxin n=1 Tax=Nakamurella alba TaxID=2665158 RepID=A0A7K1FI40_9ACTN|nr:toxin-antitoxin system HicB family antitoxin [Nakamurella alba]MTD13736.1 toxin-antitoxin system HicB family antitoxin [Nakamurella alba]